MPRIAPIPMQDLSSDSRRRIDEGMSTGMYSTPVPLQVVAHSPNALRGMDEGYKAVFGCSAIGGRIQELVRLRSAQLGSCEPCSASRKDPSLTEDDVACLVDPPPGMYTERERLAIRFVDLLAIDHHAIDADFYRELGTCFSVEEIVELGWFAAQAIGVHRFMHSLDLFGAEEPVLGGEALAAEA
jgi:alkylhydroperoxidase family enzyme